MAKHLAIRPVNEEASPGDLHVRVSGDQLLVPAPVCRALAGQGLRTATDLLSYLVAFPSAVAHSLHWNHGEVAKAVDRLRIDLAGYIDTDAYSARRPNPPLGALSPDDLPPRK